MLALGHVGLTFGAAAIISKLATLRRPLPPRAVPPASGPHPTRWPPSLLSLARYLDLRLLLAGSLLPDLIDKPLGHLFFPAALSNGRIYAHTLVFLALITLAGLAVRRAAGRNWLLVLSFGTATHLVFDSMWSMPRTLLWPAYGFAFDRIATQEWVPRMVLALQTNPSIYVSEAIGGIALLWFASILLRSRSVVAFIKYGLPGERAGR